MIYVKAVNIRIARLKQNPILTTDPTRVSRGFALHFFGM